MKPDQPSGTAFRVAMRRAAHQVLDRPLVLDDPIALRIIGPQRAEAIRADPRRYDSGFGRALRLFLVARSRCAEDALARAVAAGVRQYVVLGAGLDTFAYRNPFPPGTLRVFEVDHPATQAWKLDLLARTRIAVPDSVTHVPVDFAAQELGAELSAAGFRADTPTFFSWLGVSMYLERERVLAVLDWIARSTPPGGGIVFDYAVSGASLNLFERLVFWLMARRVAAVGEPWRARFEPRELVEHMRRNGYGEVHDLHAREINARYFAQRTDDLRVSNLARLISARI
jgi:methyltransferase (TIGR00027 family)